VIPVAPDIRIERHIPPAYECPTCGKGYGEPGTCKRCEIVYGHAAPTYPTGQAQQHRAQAAPIARTPATRGTRTPGAAPLHPAGGARR
jgi:hypothetical protein